MLARMKEAELNEYVEPNDLGINWFGDSAEDDQELQELLNAYQDYFWKPRLAGNGSLSLPVSSKRMKAV